MGTVTIPLPNPPATNRQRRVALATLGCKVNTFESELIAQQLVGCSYQRVTSDDSADLLLINTCTVTAEADRQARQLVRRAIRRNPDALVVMTGCYAQIDPAACAAIPGVDLVLGNDRKFDLGKLLPQLEDGSLPKVLVGRLDREIGLPQQLLSGLEGRARAFLQIQQGCDQACTFCIIHLARGPSRSFDPDMVMRQFQRLAMNGYREIVLCGVDLGAYGEGREERFSLAGLLRRLDNEEGDFRIRLSSIDPVHLSPDLLRVLTTSRRFCPHLHLSLQSADSMILKRMKRRSDRDLLYRKVDTLRDAIPGLVLSADILVGFPTEEDAHFKRTLAAVEELEIAYPHVFTYSRREGTPAARIPNQVPMVERKRRAARVREAGKKVWRRVARRKLGARERLLVEGGVASSDGVLRARAADYFPVHLLLSSVESREIEVGEWVDAEITGVDSDALIARRVV